MILNLESTYNTRSFGDIDQKLSDRIIRSDKLDHLSKNDIEKLILMNVQTIIDLRKPNDDKNIEVKNDKRFSYHHCFFNKISWDQNILSMSLPQIEKLLLEEYIEYVKQTNVIRDIIEVILHSKNKTLIMCNLGKDRTGVVVAILLMLTGVDNQCIIRDYASSSDNLSGYLADSPYKIFQSNPIIMDCFLGWFKEIYGSVEKYLLGAGVENSQIVALKTILLKSKKVAE